MGGFAIMQSVGSVLRRLFLLRFCRPYDLGRAQVRILRRLGEEGNLEETDGGWRKAGGGLRFS